ncbi:MAG: AAA family ATPase [Rikenellaceae bacterium]
MLASTIASQIYDNFKFLPTLEQKKLIISLSEYIIDGNESDIFVLNGYAGTGKTSVMAALVSALRVLQIKFYLLAPTGRAAKVLSQYSGCAASTIHRKIYRQKQAGAVGGLFSLNINKDNDAVFIVDEASMLSNYDTSTKDSSFGTGHLIDDLVDYVRMGDFNRLIFVGDDAQLPPVGLDFSPALNPLQMQGYGTVHYSTLQEVVRKGQGKGSAILRNATQVREYIDKEVVALPKLECSSDVKQISGSELIEVIEDCYREVGREDTIIITRSNKRAVEYNRGVRSAVLDIEEELSAGDILMVVRNNYSIVEREEGLNIDFLANGDIVVVERIIRHHEIYGFRFVTAEVRLPDYGDYVLECKLMLDTLYSPSPSLSREDRERLFFEIEKDYYDIGEKRKRYKKIMENEYWCALQVKFGYAVTCHKAQGGQWRRVLVDRMLFGDEDLTRDFQRWLYTAITRSTECLYFVNWDDEYFLE